MTIEGIAPLLMNRFTEKAQGLMDRGQTGGKKTQQQKEDDALEKVYRNAQGLYVDAHALKMTIINGAKAATLRYGKKSLAPYLKAVLFFEEQELSLGKKNPDGIDARVGRIPPRTGAAALIRRPFIASGWQLTAVMDILDDRMPEEHIKDALREGGLLIGLLDNRPEFGRFIIKDWRKLDGKDRK